MKKLLGIILLSCICIMNSKAQNQVSDEAIKKNILNFIQLKHKYEEAQSKMPNPRSGSKNALDESRASYLGAINAIKAVAVREKYLFYINKTINKPAPSDVENKVIYQYINPFSSYIDKNNFITYLDYLKIVRHSIFELNSDTLLPIRQATLYLKKK